MKLKILNIIFSILILISNIYFISATFNLIKDDGGPMGFGYVILPLFLLINLGIIPSSVVIFWKKYENKLLFILNSSVIILILYILYLFIIKI